MSNTTNQTNGANNRNVAPSAPQTHPISILFVCLGNICRSPMAEGVFRSHVSSPSTSQNFAIPANAIDSAGTAAYHISSPPDPRTTSVLAAHGITSYRHSARKVRLADFEEYDYIFAMDAENLEDLLELRAKVARAVAKKSGGGGRTGLGSGVLPLAAVSQGGKVEVPGWLEDVRVGKSGDGLAHVMLFGAFGGKDGGEEVGDPYYGGRGGFETAWEQVDRFSKGFLTWLGAATARPVGE